MCVCVILFYFYSFIHILSPASMSMSVNAARCILLQLFFKCLFPPTESKNENSENHVPLYGYIFSSRIAFHFFLDYSISLLPTSPPPPPQLKKKRKSTIHLFSFMFSAHVPLNLVHALYVTYKKYIPT